MADLKGAFNNRVIINNAYKWTDTEIMQLFAWIRDNPDFYNVESQSRASLGAVVTGLTTLVSRREILLHTPLQVRYQNTMFMLESMYDLVGWIFSVTGTTPAGATRENYYYPLAGLYSIFFVGDWLTRWRMNRKWCNCRSSRRRYLEQVLVELSLEPPWTSFHIR